MYAIAFDLVVADTEQNHPKGVSQAYADIAAILNEHGFRRVQGSLYVTDNEDMAKLFVSMQALKALPWFSKSLRDIRVRIPMKSATYSDGSRPGIPMKSATP